MTEVLPIVSVNVIAYNREKSIGDCLDSLLRQDYPNFEIIIVDDGSSDHTAEIIRSYQDLRINLYQNEANKGISFTRNKAISLSRGSLIAILDSDDVSVPTRISKQVAVFLQQKEIGMVASIVNIVDEFGMMLPAWDADRHNISFDQIRNTLWKQNCIAHSSVMIKSDIIKKYGYSSDYSSEDYDLWLNLVADNFKICKIPEVLTIYRLSQDSATNKEDERYSYFIKTRKIKLQYLQRRFKNLRFSLYDFRLIFWIFISYMPFLKKSIV